MNKKSVKILGISCFYHDSAAALLVNGKVICAAQEERFTRKKHDKSFPKNAVDYCLGSQNYTIKDIDFVIFYDKPIRKFERILKTFISVWPKGLPLFITVMRSWLGERLWIRRTIQHKLKWQKKVLFCEHHYSHAASAYYCSPFTDAVVLTMDGVGEWDTTTIGTGNGNELSLTKTITFPHSLGLLYSAFTHYLGFRVNSAEYKVMGLAPYGNPDKYYSQFKKLITICDDGSFRLNMFYFSYEYGEIMTNDHFYNLFGGSFRSHDSIIEQRHKDIAASLQKIIDEIVVKIVNHARQLYPYKNLCLAGGVALNCVANGKILESDLFENIYIQPAAGDAGGAVGAACFLYYGVLKNKKKESAMPTVYLGPQWNNDELKFFLDELSKKIKYPLKYTFISDDKLPCYVAKLLSDNNVIGWFQGKMEFGPRSLGNRSILADARKKENWQRVNLKIKFRESFRPFAPTVLEEKADEYFNLKAHISPFMLLVADVKREDIPAVTHVDNSARIQTINRVQNARYYDLLNEFYKLTGCPVIINTSFNVRGEPIVCSPEHAFQCFINTEIDYLILGNYIISKRQNNKIQNFAYTSSYLSEFELD